MAVEEILARCKVQKEEKKQIIKELKKTDDFGFEHMARLLSSYPITQDDLRHLKDHYPDLSTGVSNPFLITKIPIAKLAKNERGRSGMMLGVEMNVTLVLSNYDGSKKVYLRKFHSLSRSDWQKLIQVINEKKPGVRYLMSRQYYRNISDPDFKPGRM